ncbi:MAG: hypothetical protein LRY67_03470 [Gammaproteobacteria bacterium]|nr:hypothetical protein [Gammaproteobacteria bacterium]MCD8542291.1 hypothetical protein [Gammaproteobacteria bacterium]
MHNLMSSAVYSDPNQETQLAEYCRYLLAEMPALQSNIAHSPQSFRGTTPDALAKQRSNAFHQKLLEEYQRKIHFDLSTLLNPACRSEWPLVTQLTDYLHNTSKTLTPLLFAFPEHPVTQVLVKIAEKLSATTGEKSAFEFLLPDVLNTETSYRSYCPDLRKINLTTVLKTHVPHPSGFYLLPVALCLNPDPDSENTQVFNPYYDHYDDSSRENAVISPKAWERLWHHSTLSETLYNAQQQYDLIRNNKSTLLGQLEWLCKKFAEYGSHDGIGAHEKAAEDIYPVLISFFGYYNALPKHSPVPKMIACKVQEIRNQMFTNAGQRGDLSHRAGVVTCISLHRKDLLKRIENNREILSNISLDQTSLQRELAEAKKHLEDCRKELSSALETSDRYDHHHKIYITPPLLTTLKLSLEIHTFDDLTVLRDFTANEITELLKDNNILKKKYFRSNKTPSKI